MAEAWFRGRRWAIFRRSPVSQHGPAYESSRRRVGGPRSSSPGHGDESGSTQPPGVPESRARSTNLLCREDGRGIAKELGSVLSHPDAWLRLVVVERGGTAGSHKGPWSGVGLATITAPAVVCRRRSSIHRS